MICEFFGGNYSRSWGFSHLGALPNFIITGKRVLIYPNRCFSLIFLDLQHCLVCVSSELLLYKKKTLTKKNVAFHFRLPLMVLPLRKLFFYCLHATIHITNHQASLIIYSTDFRQLKKNYQKIF